jgi:Flp pilus assembly pilin Flp
MERFLRHDRGAALTEFAMILPLSLLLFATIVESTRMLWAYQATAAGVRDATRYVARVAPRDICPGGSLSAYEGDALSIVSQSSQGAPLFTGGIRIVSVQGRLLCDNSGWHGGPAGIAEITATLEVTFPFGGLFGLAGGSAPTLTAILSDQSRIFGT